MSVILPFIINSALNFALGLLIASFLGPAEFGRYAIGAAIVVLLNTALLDWIRISAVRFYSQKTRLEQPEIRATLDLLLAGMTLALAGILLAAVVAGVDFRLPTMLVAAAVAAGIGAGLFDYHGAIARARFMDAAYARLVMVKNLLALVLMVGGAWWTRDAAVVLLGSVISVGAALLTVRRALADAPRLHGGWRRSLARDFARYALPLVGANAIYSLIPLINRSLMADGYGYAEAGQFSLAADLGLRLFGMLGAGLEIMLLREVLRLDETVGREAALRRISDNLVIVLMVALPCAAGLYLVLPAFEALLVPAEFRGRFGVYLTLLLPGFLALCLFIAGLYPVFLLGKRTGLVTLAALAGLALNLAVILCAGALGAERFAIGQVAAFLLVLAVTGVLALRSLPALPPARELLAPILATAAMAACLLPLRRTMTPAIELAAMASLGALVYVAVLLACNTAGCRTALRGWRSARRGRS